MYHDADRFNVRSPRLAHILSVRVQACELFLRQANREHLKSYSTPSNSPGLIIYKQEVFSTLFPLKVICNKQRAYLDYS